MTKLKTGDLIQVHGWIMLKGVEARKYEIVLTEYNDRASYKFYSPRRTKGPRRALAHFYCSDVDLWVKDTDLNRIEILKST